jgi:pimeloyl-ACP methyl ester carboxylesterase
MLNNPFLPGFTARYCDIKGVRLRSFDKGAGPAVVLLHGLGGAASNWTAVAPALAERVRVVVPELPGHGGSSGLPAPVATLDAYADRVARILDAPAVVAGHSLGGLVALRLTVRHPHLVRGLVLAGAAGISTGTRRSQRAIAVASLVQPGKRIAPLRRLVSHHRVLRELAFGFVSVADPRALEPSIAEAFLAGAALHTGVREAADALVRTDPRRDLQRVRVPALVLHGARDRMVPLRDAFAYARGLDAPLRTIADSGHLLIGERPHAVVDAIGSVLDRVLDVEELRVEGELVG